MHYPSPPLKHRPTAAMAQVIFVGHCKPYQVVFSKKTDLFETIILISLASMIIIIATTALTPLISQDWKLPYLLIAVAISWSLGDSLYPTASVTIFDWKGTFIYLTTALCCGTLTGSIISILILIVKYLLHYV